MLVLRADIGHFLCGDFWWGEGAKLAENTVVEMVSMSYNIN